ncbi:hypothetical protein P4361_11785 [Fictibacillus sp. B-59209]|uniref:hypothetical protein n=1 Tax=Fictibacillus sp. B-59209 TaxID=3024873 RepID=UPI002E211E7D|nr:hypothetical protein [Fictibacillus sp. B-59209]
MTYVSSYLTEFLESNSINLKKGEKASFEQLSSICQLMAEETVNYVKGISKASSLLIYLLVYRLYEEVESIKRGKCMRKIVNLLLGFLSLGFAALFVYKAVVTHEGILHF